MCEIKEIELPKTKPTNKKYINKYFSFVGWFKSPKRTKNIIVNEKEVYFPNIHDKVMDGIDVLIYPTNKRNIFKISVECGAGNWEEEGFVRILNLPYKTHVKTALASTLGHGSAWINY